MFTLLDLRNRLTRPPSTDSEPPDLFLAQHNRLHELYGQIDQLSDEDQQALIVLLDSLLKRSKLQKVLTG